MMTIRWNIWKARNDVRLHRKKWSVLQVHHAVEADIEVASIYIQKGNTAGNEGKTKALGQ